VLWQADAGDKKEKVMHFEIAAEVQFLVPDLYLW
jgi:hypothetical protein